jgi:hypothetical protein
LSHTSSVDRFLLEDYDLFAESVMSELDKPVESYDLLKHTLPIIKMTPSTILVKSSLVRVPNTFNSKYQGESRLVNIIQKRDGNRPKDKFDLTGLYKISNTGKIQ